MRVAFVGFFYFATAVGPIGQSGVGRNRLWYVVGYVAVSLGFGRWAQCGNCLGLEPWSKRCWVGFISNQFGQISASCRNGRICANFDVNWCSSHHV